jgi:hypothetical protein
MSTKEPADMNVIIEDGLRIGLHVVTVIPNVVTRDGDTVVGNVICNPFPANRQSHNFWGADVFL